jgi:hypothetical protein
MKVLHVKEWNHTENAVCGARIAFGERVVGLTKSNCPGCANAVVRSNIRRGFYGNARTIAKLKADLITEETRKLVEEAPSDEERPGCRNAATLGSLLALA